MFAKLTTRIAMKKAGIPSNAFASIPSFDQVTGNNNANSKGDQQQSAPFENPFANMNLAIPKSWNSWTTPPPPVVEVASVRPSVGMQVPRDEGGLLRGVVGRGEYVVVFLRCCGCPFAEKTFLNLRSLANKYPNLNCIAISHCTQASTDKWVNALGGAWNVRVVCDAERGVYAAWGLGVGNTYHVLNPWTQIAQRKLGNEEGIWARENGEGGNRWQIGGAWAIDEMGVVRWGGASKTADEMPDFAEGLKELSLR